MSYNQIEQLRKSGNLREAYEMAVEELKTASEIAPPELPEETTEPIDAEHEETMDEHPLLLGKRAMAWVLYDLLKENTDHEDFDQFMSYLNEFVELDLDPEEKMVVNQLLWVIGKAAFEFTKGPDFDISRMEELLETTMKLNFTKQSKAYSFLFKALHKALKDSPKYIEFASWWDLRSFIRDDYKFTKTSEGKRIMAVVEQGCNRYAKHLINALLDEPDETTKADLLDKIADFKPIVDQAIHNNKHYRKLPYYQVKMMLATGDFKTGYKILMSKAREKHDEFWVWELLAEAFRDDQEKRTACLCTALLCRAKPEKRLGVRLDLAEMLIDQEYYDEAKTELAKILRCCLENKWEIPEDVTEWGEQAWYASAEVMENNNRLYEEFKMITDEMIYGDVPQRKIVVENVNHDKNILNFIGLDYDKGYCRFDDSLGKIKEGDVLLVRLKDAGMEGRFTLLSAKKLNEKYLEGILKHFAGEVVKPTNKAFGFVDGMFITPDVCDQYNLRDGEHVTGKAMIAYNNKKDEWGWKVISID